MPVTQLAPDTPLDAPPAVTKLPADTALDATGPQPPPRSQRVTPESERPPNEATGLLRTLGQSLLPGQRGAEAGGRIAGSVFDAMGASAGSLADLPIVGAARAAPSAAPASRQLLRDFEAAKVTPNLPAVGQGRTAGLVSNIANTLPISGPQVRAAINRTASDTAAAAERSATQYGAARLPIEGGEAAQRGVTQFATVDFPAAAQKLYGEFDRQMVNAPPVPTTATQKALEGPLKRFPTSPELGAQITNPKLRGYAETLSPKTTTKPPTLSKILDASGNPTVVKAAQTITSGGKLTFDELKELRSYIGQLIGDPVLVSDIPRRDLKSVYAGISDDLRAAAKRQSPEALAAFDKANAFYKEGIEHIDDIEFLTKGSPEQAFSRINRAAETGGSTNSGLLAKIKTALGPKEWGNVGSSIVARLGEPAAGAKDMLGTNFSPTSFATSWNKLSPAAKDELFGPAVPDSPRAGLETLARISQAQKNVGKLANVSRSGEYGLMGAMAFMAIEHYSALIAHPVATAIGVGGVYGASKLLMSPQFARWLYSLPSIVEAAPSLAEAARRAASTLAASMGTPPTPQRQPASPSPAVSPWMTPSYDNMTGQMPP